VGKIIDVMSADTSAGSQNDSRGDDHDAQKVDTTPQHADIDVSNGDPAPDTAWTNDGDVSEAETEHLNASADFSVLIHDDQEHGPAPVMTPGPLSVSVHSVDSAHQESTASAPSTPRRKGGNTLSTHRRRRRGILRPSDQDNRPRKHSVRTATLDDNGRTLAHYDSARLHDDCLYAERGIRLPSRQYETTLTRRAIRKRVENAGAPEADEGDVSLGMKLTVIRGQVIVQQLNPLADGRASPAQLTGVISRGDVLLAINGTSIVQLPLEQLMSSLQPLSSPDERGLYRRHLRLRLAAGHGLPLLKSDLNHGGTPAKANGEQLADLAAGDILGYALVDQLSGLPLFEPDQSFDTSPTTDGDSSGMEAATTSSPERESTTGEPRVPKVTSLSDLIAIDLARVHFSDQRGAVSEFFAWNAHCSDLLRRFDGFGESLGEGGYRSTANDDDLYDLTKSFTLPEFIERGKNALRGAKILSHCLEELDKGQEDIRSFQSWKTTLSLYSRASTRRRYVLDSSALPVNFSKVEEQEEYSMGDSVSPDHTSADSRSGSDRQLALDGDELLLRLAAHDDIWRKQVLEFLGNLSVSCSENAEEEIQQNGHASQANGFGDVELGSFLFGNHISTILKKHKKPQALPPDEITAVLFDLTTKISTTVPDEITAAGSLMNYRSNLVPFTGMKRPRPDSDIMIATRFLLDEVLPMWLTVFRPLPWDQRRMLWPIDRHQRGSGSTVETSLSDDSGKMESASLFSASVTSGKKRRKDLREMIEDQVLDPETRSET
jgi:hypothetical protein